MLERSTAITVERVQKSFPVRGSWLFRRAPRALALDDISLTVEDGEIFGLLGPNGAGKTTLLKLLATLAIPDAGTIRVAGIATHEQPREARRRVAYCGGGERSFYFRLTGRENLEFFGGLLGLGGATLRKRIAEAATAMDLADRLDHRYAAYSTGTRQRLAIARALLGRPRIVLFDEPTRAVDPIHADALRRFIRERLVGELGMTAVVATNQLDEAWSLCARVAVLDGGRIAALDVPQRLGAGTPAAVFASLLAARDA